MNNVFFGFIILCLFMFVLCSLPADHERWVVNFKANEKLEREFGKIEPRGTTDQFTAFLYQLCLNDPKCGTNK